MSKDGFKDLRFPWQGRRPRDVRIDGPVGPVRLFSIVDGKTRSTARVDATMTKQDLIDAIDAFFYDKKIQREEKRDALEEVLEQVQSCLDEIDEDEIDEDEMEEDESLEGSL